mgnify:CR=1 FL=1
MQIRTEAVSPVKKRTSILCAFCFEDTNIVIGLGKLNKKIDQIISQSVKEINGKKGKISIIHSYNEIPSERILIAGLGKKNKLTSDVIRDVTGIITKKIHELKIREFSIIIPEKISIRNEQIISTIVEGANLSLYKFDLFKKEKSNKKEPDLTLLTSDKNAQKIIKNSNILNYENLPFQKYISLLNYSSVIIGNSSSGIMEAPFLQVPSINVGTRQEGRSNTTSIINVKYNKKASFLQRVFKRMVV